MVYGLVQLLDLKLVSAEFKWQSSTAQACESVYFSVFGLPANHQGLQIGHPEGKHHVLVHFMVIMLGPSNQLTLCGIGIFFR